ncbi:MAG: hypothetical protein H8D34_04620 [Chloroflexi bacterium]|nr:hypothetical protein [Chloroflexota bacterium]MBL7162528.1 hypothetical protein [Anaerolineales bacterium]
MNRSKTTPIFITGLMITLTLSLLMTSTVSARRAGSDSWSNPACSEPSSTLSGNSYEAYIMAIRGTSTYEYIPADCPSCNAPAAPAPRNNDDDEEEYHSPAPAPAPVPTACVPQYHAPTLSMGGYIPPYPLVLGQDPDKLGVDVTITAQGGAKTNSCPGDSRGTITTFQLDEVTLSPEAIARIQGELQKAYPGAHVLGSYPLHPAPSISLGSNATLRFHFDPQDPGAYNVLVTVTQHDGQTASQTFQVPAHLLEATISW